MAVAQELPVTVAVDAPVIRAVPDPSDHDVRITDGAFYRLMILGAIVGIIVMTALSVGMAAVGGIDLGTSLALAPVPGVVAGVFFGGNALIGRAIARAERDR